MGLTNHYELHMCPDCGLCWCACDDCKTRPTWHCVCQICNCEEWHSHDTCPAGLALMAGDES